MLIQLAARLRNQKVRATAWRRAKHACSALALALALASAGPTTALEIEWISDIDGDWDDAANWDGATPGPLDDVTIDRGATDVIVTHELGDTHIISLLLAETISVVAGSTLTTSVLTAQDGATILADGAGSLFRSTGATAVDGSNLRATNGARLDLAAAPSLAAGALLRTPRSDGTESRIDLSGALTLRGATTVNSELLVDAIGGGWIDLSRVSEIADGSVRFVANGAGSVIDLSSASRFVDSGGSRDISRIEARSGGSVLLDTSAPLSIAGYDIVRDGAGSTLDTSMLESLVDSRVTVVGTGTSLDLAFLGSADNNSFIAVDGAALTLVNTSYASEGSQSLRAEGTGSILDLATVQSFSGAALTRNVVEVSAVGDGRFWQAEIVSGGLGDLLRLTVVVPEPSTALLLGLGLMSIARTRRAAT